MEETIERLKQWVLKHYDQHATGYTWERSAGNSADCFYDGMDCGESWAAHTVGSILGMELPEPECEEDE